MASIKALSEYAIIRMMAGEDPPTTAFVAVADAEGNIPTFNPSMYNIPDEFPNPPPPRPLRGIDGARMLLAQCGCDTPQIEALVSQGFINPERFQLFTDQAIDNLVNNLFRTPAADGGCKIPAATAILLKALVAWVDEQMGYGTRAIDAYNLTIPALMEWERSLRANKGPGKSLHQLIDKPTTFDPVKWITWKDGLANYLSNVTGVSGIPLAYVIRENLPSSTSVVSSLSTMRIRNQAHTGPTFQEDNLAVYSVLHQSLLNTEGWTHIAEHELTKDGKAAFASLCFHYDGPSAVSNRIAWAKKEIATSIYKSEQTFSLEKYGNRLANAFRVLRQNGQPKAPGDEVDIYFSQIQSQNPNVQQAIAIMRYQADCDTDFTKARAKLQEMLAKTNQTKLTMAPQGTPAPRKISQVKQAKNKAKQNTNTSGSNAKTVADIVRKDGKEFFNGVDITDRGRTFSYKEFRKIKPIFHEYIAPNRPSKDQTANISAVSKEKQHNGNKFGTNNYA